MNEQATIEALAAYAHEAWAGWMKYLFEKSFTHHDGSVEIPAALVQRWNRQINTPYAELPENEKESDRAEARKIIEIAQRRIAEAQAQMSLQLA